MDNYVGKRLDGRYEIQEIIGVGGMSVVYKAYDNVDDRIVAVKILKDEFMSNDEFIRRFKNESKAIALLSHSNIVKVYDVSFGEKLQYIVMEYVDGITLKEYIQKQGAITWNDALFFTTQILKALQHAHDKGIVHRDIKPQNIILLSNGNIKVADFGIARFSHSDTKTLTDQAIGSVHYISPEQAKGELTDERADIYSLGVVLYEMLTGRVPFDADSAVSVALMQVQNNAKKLREINPDIPVGLEQICTRAMQKDPNERYQSATEMLLDVEEVIRNPKTEFDYSYFVDREPTKYVNPNAEQGAAQEPEQPEQLEEPMVDDYYDPDHRKKVVSAIVIGVVVLVAAVLLVIMAFTGKINTSTSSLDNFVGLSYDELKNSNKYKYNFVMEQKKTDEAAPGIIIAQSPDAGTKVLSDSQVTLIVAASLDDINVPNLYGLTEEKAKKALENVGLNNYTITTVSSDTVEVGQVVYSDPKAGNVVSSDKQIVIYISSGPTSEVKEEIVVPDVTGLKKEGARAFLEKAGFTNISFSSSDNEIPKDVVLSQTPAAGTKALADDTIKLVISSGVTTTTTKPSSKISLTVKLPACINENGDYVTDSIVITLDGETYLSQTVTLNGGKANVSIKLEGEDDVKIKTSLNKTGAVETKTANGKSDKSLNIDFSGFSFDNHVETTAATTEEPTSEQEDTTAESTEKNSDEED